MHTNRDFNPPTTNSLYPPVHKPAFYRLWRGGGGGGKENLRNYNDYTNVFKNR